MKIFKNSIIINIGKGFIWQGLGILATLISLPISIKFLGNHDFGLWITIYGTVMWMSSFDFGIGNGFRNELTVSFTRKDKEESVKIVTNAFISISTLSLILVFIGLTINLVIFEGIISDINYPENIYILINILILLFGIEITLKLTGIIFTADLRSSITPLITGMNNILVLIVVYLFYYNRNHLVNNELFIYGITIGAIPIVSNGLLTLIAFSNGYKYLIPKLIYFDNSWIKRILRSGIKFFGIQVSMILLLQLSNIMVLTWSGPEFVTVINIAEKYFGIISIVGTIILFPFWSAFTAANERGDIFWIKNTISKLEFTFFVLFIIGIVLLLFFPYFVAYWFNKSIFIPQLFAVIIMLKNLFLILNSVYSYYLNGIGKVKLQLILYAIFAVLNVPVSWILFKLFGTVGVIIFLPVAMMIMAITQKIHTMNTLKL
jgi:O-antigen/teichoic acid export membrane protein